jgi:hypothetical protein
MTTTGGPVALPRNSYEPWQVLVAVGALIVILLSAYALAQVHPLAVSGLVPVLAGARRLIPNLLVKDPVKERDLR